MLSGIKHVVSTSGLETEFDNIDDAVKFAQDRAAQTMQPAYVLSPVATMTPVVNVTVTRQDKEVTSTASLPQPSVTA
jgi:hypothetical protein